MKLTVTYIGAIPFPHGAASTKRIRNQIDYLNSKNISTNVLITRTNGAVRMENGEHGFYNHTKFFDIGSLFHISSLNKYYREGYNFIRKCYKENAVNIMIFPTTCAFYDMPFFLYAKYVGYKIIFDKVETSYLHLWRSMTMTQIISCAISETVSYFASKYSDASFVISSRLEAEERKKHPRTPTYLLPNSTPILNNPEKTGFNNRLQVFYAGSYGMKDGVAFLIEAVRIANDCGVPCELMLAGKGAQKCMEMLNIDVNCKYVKYVGFISEDELNKYMVQSDILVMPRVNTKFANYGFPFKLSEYLSTGNLVIATRVGDVPSYLEDKESALLVEPESAQSIAEAIIYVHHNPEKCSVIRQAGRKVMEKCFSIDVVGKQLEAFLSLIARG